MRLKIAEKIQPFSHLPGTSCVLPGSSYQLQIFPCLILLFDLSQGIPTLVYRLELDIQGPVQDFTIFNDLEKGKVSVWGKSPTGFFRYHLLASAEGGVCLSLEKSPFERLHLIEADAIYWLSLHAKDYDVIYLDPMFPGRTKSAAVKKEMRILRDLVGYDLDADRLFAAALACPVSRIVVKRPIHAPILGAKEGTVFSIKGRANRFDVYIRPSFSSTYKVMTC